MSAVATRYHNNYRRGAHLLLLVLLCLSIRPAAAQLFVQKRSAVNITSPQYRDQTVAALVMDKNGHIWIGTLNGLFVTRGNTIAPFTLPIPNDKVISTLYLHGNHLYVGTNEGITRIDINTYAASTLALKDENGNTIHNYCMVVHVNRGKMLYYTGYNEASYYEYDLKTGKSTFLFNHSDGYRAIKTNGNGDVTKLWAIETTGLLEHDMLNRSIGTKYLFKGYNGQPILSIQEARLDATDTLWCATNKGLVGMDINTHSYRQVTFPQYDAYELADVIVHGQDVICATANAGLIVWNRITNKSTQILHRPDDPYSVLSDKVGKLQIVNDKLLVVATNKGISVLPLDASLQFAYTPGHKGTIHNIASGRKQRMAGIGNYAFLINNNDLYATDSLQLAGEEYALTAHEVINEGWLVVTNTRVLWWKGAKAISLNTIPARHLICERIVKGNDSIYYICGQTGIYTWHTGDAYITPLKHADNEPYQWYNTVIPLNDSMLLSNAYLSFIKGHKKIGDILRPTVLFKMFSNVHDWLLLSKDDILIAGTNGISRINMKEKSLRPVDTSFHEHIYRFICRVQDTLLVGERSVYRLLSGRVIPYPTPFNGLQNISTPDALIFDYRYLWHTNGAELYRMPFHIFIDKEQYYHAEVRYKGAVVEGDITLPANTTLQLLANHISYLPYVQPQLQYRLLGVDNSWNTLEGEQIRYTQLQPGRHTLIIQAKAGTQTLYYKQLVINSRPAWYQTVWATIGLFFLFIAVVLIIFRWRIRVIDQRSKEALALQRQMNELENKALRAQMNPHFLFNTLNSINHYILNNDTKEASHYLTRFSKLVRLVLDNSRREYISLEKELEALNIYLELEMMRRNNEFDYSIKVNKEVAASSFLVPPLILQPFVENAIWHGLSTIAKDGFIEITAVEMEEDSVCITIEDNGIGYKPTEKKGHSSFGMSGTRERLTLMHPKNDYKIEALYDEGGKPSGTRVSVYIYND